MNCKIWFNPDGTGYELFTPFGERLNGLTNVTVSDNWDVGGCSPAAVINIKIDVVNERPVFNNEYAAD